MLQLQGRQPLELAQIAGAGQFVGGRQDFQFGDMLARFAKIL